MTTDGTTSPTEPSSSSSVDSSSPAAETAAAAAALRAPASRARSSKASRSRGGSTSSEGEAAAAAAVAAAAAGAGGDTDADAAGATGGKGAKKLRPRGNVCLQCREQKVHCAGGAPCERCFRLALPCRPQDYAYTAQEAEPGGRRQWLRRKLGYCRRRPGKDQEGWEPIEGSPLLALAFQRCSPRVHAEVACEVFMSLFQEGRVLRPRAMAFLRSQGSMIEVCGSDPTWGLLPLVSQTANAGAIDMETPMSLLLDRPPQARVAMTRARLACMQRRREAMKQEPWFRDMDDGTAVLYCAAPSFDDNGTPMLVVVSNAVAEARFQAAQHFFSDLVHTKTVAYLLFCTLVAPEDRRAYLQSFFRLIFTTTTERQREFIKMFDADGEIRLFLLEAFLRPRPPPALPAFVCRLEPLPKSRHLTLRPEYRATLQALQSDSAAAGPGIGGESSQPPLPPPPPPPPLPVQPGPGALLPLRTGAGTAGGGQGQAAWMADAVAMAASGGSGPGLVPGMASMPLPLAPSGRGIGVVGLTHAEAGATGAERGPTASPVPVGASAAAADAATAAVARGAGGAFSPTALSLHQWVSTEASTGGGPDFGSLARAPIHVRDAATSTQPDPNPDPWHAVAGGGGGQGEGLGMGMGGMPPPRAPSSPSVGLWLPAGGGGGGVGGEGVPVVDFEMLEQVFAEEEEGEEGGGGGGF